MIKQKLFLLLFPVLIVTGLQAQTKYWVFLTDKDDALYVPFVSEKTLSNRLMLNIKAIQYTDLPVKRQYIRQIGIYGKIIHQSKWLNALSMILTNKQYEEISHLSFVQKIVPIKSSLRLAGTLTDQTEEHLYSAIEQINGYEFEKENLTAKGVCIGITDGNFSGAGTNPYLSDAYLRVRAIKDFIKQGSNIFEESAKFSDTHGTAVWQLLAGKDKLKNSLSGLATQATYYLARTEHSEKEYRGEEDSWVAALEWMDSLGVRLINTSLGYSTGFDNPDENYLPVHMDGHTSVIAKAADIAIQEKGMIIVVAAGNEGKNKGWHTVSTPADVHSAISVGATDRFKLKEGSSSTGAPNSRYLKPDIACFSSGGTSLATPIITGIIACLLQKDPTLTNHKIKELLMRSGSLYPFANNYLGYGVPNGKKLLQLLASQNKEPAPVQRIHVKNFYILLKGKEYSKGTFTVFHKSNERDVLTQSLLIPIKDGLMIERAEGALYTTVSSNKGTIEIKWQ